MIFLEVLTAKILWRVKTEEKIIKTSNQCPPFLTKASHNRGLCAKKIKKITTLKRIMTSGNIILCKKPKKR